MPLIDSRTALDVVQKLLIEDSDIITALQLDNATTVEKAQAIIKRRIVEGELADNKSRVCIYFRPSRGTRNRLVTEEVLQIDAHVPVTRDMYAYDVVKRVNKLLHDKEIGGRRYYYDGELGDLPTASGYFCAGIRFTFVATVINP